MSVHLFQDVFMWTLDNQAKQSLNIFLQPYLKVKNYLTAILKLPGVTWSCQWKLPVLFAPGYWVPIACLAAGVVLMVDLTFEAVEEVAAVAVVAAAVVLNAVSGSSLNKYIEIMKNIIFKNQK